jgi:hypothetical protein
VGSGDPKVLIYFTAVVSVEDLPELLSFDIIDVDAQLAKPQQLSTSSNFRFEQLQQLSCNLMQLPQRQQFILHSFYLNGLLDKSTATSSRKLLIPASPAPEYEVASNCHCHCRAVQAVQYPVPRSGNRVCTLMLETCTLKSSNLATNPPQKYIAQLHNIHQ